MTTTLVGILARVDRVSNPRLVQDLDGMDGVSTFEVGDPGKLGILLESGSTEDAHRILTERIGNWAGVLATWPVYSHFGEEFAV